MTEPRAQPIGIVDFRAEHYSADGKSIIVSFATMESAERRSYALPVQALYGFTADLQKLQRPTETKATSDAPKTQARTADSIPVKDPTRVNIRVPRKWMLRPGPPDRPLVIMVFDPQTEAQVGFGLTEKAAREMAAGLVKQADALADQAKRPKAN